MNAAITEKFEAVFERDMAECKELTLDEWQKRGWMHRMKDHALYLFNEMKCVARRFLGLNPSADY